MFVNNKSHVKINLCQLFEKKSQVDVRSLTQAGVNRPLKTRGSC